MPAKRGKSDAGVGGSATRASTRRSERTVQGSDVARSASAVAGSASDVARSASAVGGSGSAVGRSGSAVGGSGSAVAWSVSAAGGSVAGAAGVSGGGVLAAGRLLESLPLEQGESSQQQASSEPKRARKKRVEHPRNPRFNDQENTALVTGILEHYDSLYGHLVGGPPPQRLILTPLEELLRGKLLPVVVEGLAGDRDIGIYPSQFPPAHDDDDDDAAIDTEMQSSDHDEVPIERVTQANRPSSNTYDAIVASEEKIVEAENRRHSDLIVFIEVPKQMQKINTSLEAIVVQLTQGNHLRMTTAAHPFSFTQSEDGCLHATTFSPQSSDVHSPGRDVTGKVAESSVHVPDNILTLPSVEILELTPTKEAPKTKMHKQLLLTSFWTQTKKPKHETDQPSVVHCVPTWSHVSVGTSPAREQSLATSPARKQSLATSPARELSLATSPAREQSLATSPAREQSLATSPAREVPQATQTGSVVPKVVAKRKRKIQETTSRPVTRSQKEKK
ncbi:hypothetical protein FKM82_030293 [Ascaphus truei]